MGLVRTGFIPIPPGPKPGFDHADVLCGGRRMYVAHTGADRIACPWLIKNFIDSEAEFLYVPADQVLDVAEREGAHSYDAPGAEYTHRDGLCSFEVLLEEYRLDDPALQLLARIVHGADVADDRDATPQSRGLLAVAEGFHLLNLGDHRQLELSLPVYDALYAWCKNEVGSAGESN